jgi:LPS export ABC transporter protein LptC
MKKLSWTRPFAYVAVIGAVAAAYFIGRTGRGIDAVDEAAQTPDPGYAAHDAVIIETGYDGRERYRLNAKVIRQQTDGGTIELESLDMDYHPGAQPGIAGEARSSVPNDETWHLRSDQGVVRADGDDVLLKGNVRVTGAKPGAGQPMVLSTSELRMNTPTEYIETSAPVTLSLSGHEVHAVGMKADLKAGTLSLESRVHGQFSPR